jgi:hypothetical protein
LRHFGFAGGHCRIGDLFGLGLFRLALRAQGQSPRFPFLPEIERGARSFTSSQQV